MNENPTLTVAADCLLSNIDLEVEKQLKDQLTIDNPKYQAAKKYGRWIGKQLKPQLTYYDTVPRGLRFPRGFSNQAVLICRHHYGSDPEIIDKRRKLALVDFNFTGALRPYQQEAVDAASSRSFGVIEAGTGSGKTVIALALIAARKQPTMVVVHTKELLYQWQQRVRQFLDVEPGLVGDGKFDPQPLTVGIVNSVKKRVDELREHFGQLVVDECHRVPATLFTEVVSRFDSHYMLGLSATAFRSEAETTRLIYYFLGDSIHRVDQHHLRQTGAILAPEVIRVSTAFTYNYMGDYQALIKALVKHEGRNLQIIGDILHDVEEKRELKERATEGAAERATERDMATGTEAAAGTLLVVSDRVEHCRFFADKLRQQDVRAELLHGQLAPEERLAIVDAVQRGETEVLVATLQLISEGFDCPGLDTLFLTTPISFEGRLLQVIGRIMRPAAGKRARVYDYVDDNIPTLLRSARNRELVLTQL